MTTVSKEAYANMKSVITEIYNNEENVFNCHKTKVLIKTPVEHFWIALTEKELEQAVDLFEMSNLILETEYLLPIN